MPKPNSKLNETVLRNLLARASPSLSDAAKRLGLSRQHIYRVLAGKQSPERLFRGVVENGLATDQEIETIRTQATKPKDEPKDRSEAAPLDAKLLREFLIEKRKNADISANALAKRSKVPQSGIWRYEKLGTNMSPSTAGKIARALGLTATEIDELFTLQQGVAPASLKGGNAAWECAMKAALTKQGFAVQAEDSFSHLPKVVPLLPHNVGGLISAQMLNRSQAIEQNGVNAKTVDAVILHSDGMASLVCVEIITLPLGRSQISEQETTGLLNLPHA